ncbi:MAG: PTS sugar transporter subunit IIA, partial [Phycisphaerales bacterium]|nr:PTS sugar transporter subunit IIA [Phycisphaerales bacterium]
MRLEHYLAPEQILMFPATSKQSVLDQLSNALATTLEIDSQILRDAVWAREALMSTGIGGGIGVPHVRLKEVKRATMAVGVCPGGITDYESIDASDVHLAVLIAAPAGEHELYIRLLARVADVLRSRERREAIL